MATFKIGDRVISISSEWVDRDTLEEDHSVHPERGDKFYVDGVDGNYLTFEEIPDLDETGERHFFHQEGFRKLQHDFRNHETAELVNQERREAQDRLELQEDELRIFTINGTSKLFYIFEQKRAKATVRL